MRSQRPKHLPPAIDATAESLPFQDNTFDAAMASFTIHQWTNLQAGLTEMRRVTRGPILILSCDPHLVERFWLNQYAPMVLATEARRYPPLQQISSILKGTAKIVEVPIPLLCKDGFNEAYYGRPEILHDPRARQACSAWSFIDQATTTTYVNRLRRDLESGAWDAKHASLRHQPTFDGSLRLLIATR